jgi:hypothetical protein
MDSRIFKKITVNLMYTEKVSFIIAGKIKTFHNNQKLQELDTNIRGR